MKLKPNYETERLNWIDQVKGFAIFLVVYAHNFPFNEKYIYSFHMPLFIMIAGFFHPSTSSFTNIKKRFNFIIIPYFIWSFLLFIFWFFLGRKYGSNVPLNLSPIKNLIGVFYSQGGQNYMDWGIPLWFLPFIFCTFLILDLIKKINNKTLLYIILTLIPIIGFIYTRFNQENLVWSINIAMVGLLFYAFGNYFLKKITSLSKNNSILLMFFMGLINLYFYNSNTKIDMYRAYYGIEFYFILNGICGSLFILLFFKTFPFFKFLESIGKFSMTILALQLLAMTFIKFTLLKIFNQSEFNFSEWEKFQYSILQIIILTPSFFLINKYLPILNGGYKKI
ncbi:acyltransferase family protein [Flavobacterium sp. WC2509]|uniref:acyltransferase family protein n=1 Tax=Flavobacterium sp. WC2509 TaxID=3461406 RepID=UPI004044F0EE